MTEAAFISRLLEIIEQDIVPKTQAGVAAGNKLFGAAILRKPDLSVVIAETNNELENPLWHGEVHALKRFYELPKADRPDTKDCIFLATHEPCSLCLSAITWTGFDNFYYLFSHEDSRDSFAIPHDLRILKEVFTLDPGGYKFAKRLLDRPLHPADDRGIAGTRAHRADRPRRCAGETLRRIVHRVSIRQAGQRHPAELAFAPPALRHARRRSPLRA